jgi:small conductance mechanosensitive channel
MTVYSLALNISKYVIYLLALGYILTELGVNYTMYFASLSVVGLAIGFGSQGLVQDMVTGFFIVFEEQFNVGDMVEIPPHTGVVEELGLRMTRLRNYLGQSVVIPNRNIAVVGNYLRGAQQAYLDVAVAAGTDVEKAREVLRRIAEKSAGQFQDIILSGPKTIEDVPLSSGERFLRLNLAIWPQQQWVIEQELVPRICAMMKAEGFEIPHDKIVVFYHPRETRSVARRKRRDRTQVDTAAQ